MPDTLVGVSPLRKAGKTALTPEEVERNGTGPDRLLKAITKQVTEAALEEEMTEYVGYDKDAVQGRNGGNSRNRTRTRTLLTDNAGKV
jgi:transposase-like protein